MAANNPQANQAGATVARLMLKERAQTFNGLTDKQKKTRVQSLGRDPISQKIPFLKSQWGQTLTACVFSSAITFAATYATMDNDNAAPVEPIVTPPAAVVTAPTPVQPTVDQLSAPYDTHTTAMFQQLEGSGRLIFMAPLDYPHDANNQQAMDLAEELNEKSQYLPIIDHIDDNNAMIIAGDARWAGDDAVYPGSRMLIDDIQNTRFQSETFREIFVDGLREAQTDAKNYTTEDDVTYMFNIVVTATPNRLDVIRDIGSDYTTGSNADDMTAVYSVDLQ